MKLNFFILLILMTVNAKSINYDAKYSFSLITGLENYRMKQNNVLSQRKLNVLNVALPNSKITENNYIELSDFEKEFNLGYINGLILEKFFFTKNMLSVKYSFSLGNKGKYYYTYSPSVIYYNPGFGIQPESKFYYPDIYYYKKYRVINQRLCLTLNKYINKSLISFYSGLSKNNYYKQIKTTMSFSDENFIKQETFKTKDIYYNFLFGFSFKRDIMKFIRVGFEIDFESSKAPNFFSSNNSNIITESLNEYIVDLYRYSSPIFYTRNSLSINFIF